LNPLFKISSLDDMIKSFFFFQSCIKSEEDFELIMQDAQNYFKRNRIVYSEVFFSPTYYLKNGLNFNKIMKVVDKEIKKIKKATDITVRIIVDVSRTFGVKNAANNLNYTFACGSKNIIGIGLGGAELGNSASKYKSLFKKARAAGLKVVVHAGEEDGPKSIWNAMNDCKAMRIGHGTSAIYDPRLMRFLRETQIPLEVCPTSNVITKKYVKRYQDHPVRKFFEYGLFVTINTDDPVLFSIELSEEYYNLYLYLRFNLEEIIILMRNNLFATFMSDEAKEELWNKISGKMITLYKRVFKSEMPTHIVDAVTSF
jgi:adenosine deaminase